MSAPARVIAIAAGVALASAFALAGFHAMQAANARADAAKVRTEFADYRAAAQRQAREATEAHALETARRIKVQSEVVHAEALKTQAAAADGVRAAAADSGLRNETARLAARGRAAAGDPALAADRQAAGATEAVLAELLGRCSERRRELAGYADSARIAGETCERAYDALTPQ